MTKIKMKRVISILCAIAVVFAGIPIGYAETKVEAADSNNTEVTPIQLEGYQNVTISDFLDSNGTAMEEKEYVNAAFGEKFFGYQLCDSEGIPAPSMDKKLLSMKIAFHKGNNDPWASRIHIGATDEMLSGIGVYADGGTLYFAKIGATTYGTVTTAEAKAAGVRINSFLDTEFMLQVAFTQATGGVKLGIYINGVHMKDVDCVNENVETTLGTYFKVYSLNLVNPPASSVTLKAVTTNAGTEPEPEEPGTTEIVPVELEGYQNVTLDDFLDSSGTAMEEKEYVNAAFGEKFFGYQLCDSEGTLAPSMDKKLLSMKIKFHKGNNDPWASRIHIGATDEMLSGIGVYADGGTLYFAKISGTTYGTVTTAEAKAAGVTIDSFLDTEFMLQVAFTQETDGVTLGIYINGVHVKDIDCVNENVETTLGTYFKVYSLNLVNPPASSVTLKAVTTNAGTEPEPEEPGTTEIVPVELEGYQNVTLDDFLDGSGTAMEEKEYINEAYGEAFFEYQLCDSEGTLVPSMDKKLLSMKITFHKGNNDPWASRIHIGATDEMLSGIGVYADGGTLYFAKISGTTYGTVTTAEAKAAGVTIDSFLDTEFMLQVAFTQETDGVTLGIYINGVHMKDIDCVNENVETTLGNYFTVYSLNLVNPPASSVTLKAVTTNAGTEPEPEEPGTTEIVPVELEGFQTIKVDNFVDRDGYEMEGGEYIQRIPGVAEFQDFTMVDEKGNAISTFDKKLLTLKVKLSKGSWTERIQVAGNDSAGGFAIYSSPDGNTLSFTDINYAPGMEWHNPMTQNGHTSTFTKTNAGIDSFLNQEILLQISFSYGDYDEDGTSDDVQMAFYFNGRKYSKKPVTILNCNMNKFGNYLSFYLDGDAMITVYKDKKGSVSKQPNENFRKRTFASFGIQDGEYSYESTQGVLVSGKGKVTLDETVICGDIKLPENGGIQFMIGGRINPWHGILFYAGEDGQLRLGIIEEDRNETLVVFDEKRAKTEILGQWIHFMMSTEYVDADGDGQEDDVEVGIWFNKVLYGNKYITILDAAPKLGSQFGLSCWKEGAVVTFRSIQEYNVKEPFNYEAFGLTKDWERILLENKKEPYTGDVADYVGTVLMLGVSFSALLCYSWMAIKQKRKKEEL